MHGKVVVKFGKYSSLIVYYEKITHCESKHNRTRSNVSMHTKTPSVTIQENITAMRYRNDVIRSVLLLHIRDNLGMMLTRDYASCHVAISTLLMIVANNVQNLKCKKSGFKTYRPLMLDY